ncbi:hypothetical protein [Winogradskyella pulchriflava]|uniref:Uncharacterized protein n=1 Tax=Winogradskyella pulchriflava TaxID=1110688 RepID=A0ABV6QEW0_9FLAO
MNKLKAQQKAIIRQMREEGYKYFEIEKHFKTCAEEILTEENNGKPIKINN